jgi:hypothetical protein
MSTLKAKINTTSKVRGKQKGQQSIVAQSVRLGAFDIGIGELSNVNTAGQSDGAMMQFNASTGNYEMKTTIENENLNISSGTY